MFFLYIAPLTCKSVAQWLALLPHSKSWVQDLRGAGPFCAECGFSPGAPASSHNPKGLINRLL